MIVYGCTFGCGLFLFLLSSQVYGELYSAIEDLEILVPTKLELVRQLDTYIQAEETRLTQLRSFLEEYESMYEEANADISKYLANPVNAFLLVKRLSSDWKKVEDVISQNIGLAFVQNLTQHRNVLRFPSGEDLTGAALALMRLQNTYLLDTHALAEGKVFGDKYSRQLTAGDCWELGRQSYNTDDHHHTVLWMREALVKYKIENKKTVALQDILDYLSFSTYKQGHIQEALELTEELLKVVPFHKRAIANKKYFQKLFSQQHQVKEKEQEPADVQNISQLIVLSNEKYERLCRGEKLLKPKIASRLRCSYTTNNVPFLFLQPIKMEEAYLKPRIVIYHDVISDQEIETIKRLAQPKFQRATAKNHRTGKFEKVHYRVCKSAWLNSEVHDHVFKTSRRVADVTGLDMDTAEDLQVVNYGIGGHYEPHVDYARGNETIFLKHLDWGNRIATWLFYMSDVESGGATVFPEIDVTLWPKKGSAAFWYNLYPNGQGNDRTRHAACPVLTGSKWVSNKWIHERKQEFRRPCGLHENAEM